MGVRFDSAVPGGVDLGGSCEEGYGFFCAASELLLDGSRSDEEAESAAVAALFELAGEVAARGPVVIHIRVGGQRRAHPQGSGRNGVCHAGPRCPIVAGLVFSNPWLSAIPRPPQPGRRVSRLLPPAGC